MALYAGVVVSYPATIMSLILALILDRLVGDPQQIWSRVPHPAAAIGRVIGWADQRYNRPEAGEAVRRRRGLILSGLLVVGALVAGRFIDRGLDTLPLGAVLEIVLVAIVLAHRSLTDHVGAVAAALAADTPRDERLAAARDALSHIVGRDVSDFDTPKIARAAIESLAENFSDGVVAPAFWYALLGLPGLLAYKVINTADSMIGYKTDRHGAFGFGAAKTDDAANYLPARIAAHLIRTAARLSESRKAPWDRIAEDARAHASPNAGWPEAAMAHGLGIALGGPRTYAGKAMDGAWLNEGGGRDVDAGTIGAAIAVANMAWVLLVGLALAFIPVAALVHWLF